MNKVSDINPYKYNSLNIIMKRGLISKIGSDLLNLAAAGLFALNLSYGNAFAQDANPRVLDSYISSIPGIQTRGVDGILARLAESKRVIYTISDNPVNLENPGKYVIPDCAAQFGEGRIILFDSSGNCN